MPTRLRTDRFGDTWSVHTGPEARRIRGEIKAENEAALARYDVSRSEKDRDAIVVDVEGEIGRRLMGVALLRAAALPPFGSSPFRSRAKPADANAKRKRA